MSTRCIATLIGTLVLVVVSPAGQATPNRWTKVFDVAGSRSSLSALWAEQDGEWFAGGDQLIVHGSGARVEQVPQPGRVILGFGSDGHHGLFAVGADQLVLRLDGQTWIQEHVGPQVHGRSQFDNLLHSVMRFESRRGAPLVAFGPSLVLVRQQSRAWATSSERERQSLVGLIRDGPNLALPPGCRLAGWQWLRAGLGWLFCHDSRLFVFNSASLAPTGKLPGDCGTSMIASDYAYGVFYASCGLGHLWSYDHGVWQHIDTPDRVRMIAATAQCLLIGTGRAIWRKCH